MIEFKAILTGEGNMKYTRDTAKHFALETCKDICTEARAGKQRCMAVADIPGRGLARDFRVPREHTGNVHHLAKTDDTLPANK